MLYRSGNYSYELCFSHLHIIPSIDQLSYLFNQKSYKLAPENAHPIPLDDCWIATKYIAENANSLSIDDNQIILLGDSAGI